MAEFRERGIEVKMITGDAKETAIAISQQLSMSQKRAVSGKEFVKGSYERYFCSKFGRILMMLRGTFYCS